MSTDVSILFATLVLLALVCILLYASHKPERVEIHIERKELEDCAKQNRSI